jgi:hypothetical protein
MRAFFYQRPRAAGPQSALIAVARKLVVAANTLITNDRMCQPQAPNHAPILPRCAREDEEGDPLLLGTDS